MGIRDLANKAWEMHVVNTSLRFNPQAVDYLLIVVAAIAQILSEHPCAS